MDVHLLAALGAAGMQDLRQGRSTCKLFYICGIWEVLGCCVRTLGPIQVAVSVVVVSSNS